METEGSPQTARAERGCFGRTMAALGAVLSLVFLLNLTCGVVEIPDNLPFVGNLDEAAAAAILFGCLRYLGVDVLPFGRRGKKLKRR